MRQWGLAAAAALCLLLAACAAPEEAETVETEVSVLGEAAELIEEETLLTVDGRKVPAWRYLYWLAFTCDQIQDRCKEANTVLDWNAPVDSGTLSDYAKQQALADAVLYATVENWAETYGCALGAEEQAAVETEWEAEAEAAGGEEACLAALAYQGLDRARWEVLTETGQLYAKLCQLYEAQEGPFQPSAPQPVGITVDRLLVAAGEDRDAARERIAEFFSQLNTAEDSAAAFTALAAASDDPAGPRTFTPGDGMFLAPLEEAALSLEPGQFSGIIESEEGFSILLRLNGTDDAALEKEPSISFDDALQAAAERAVVELAAAYGKINPAVFSKSLQTIRSTRGLSSS